MQSWMIGFVVTVLGFAWSPYLPPKLALLVCLIAGVILSFCRKSPLLLLAGLFIGIAYSGHFGHQLLASLLPPWLEGEDIQVIGQVDDLTQPVRAYGRDGTRFSLRVNALRCPATSPEDCSSVQLKRLRLTDYTGLPINPGEQYRLMVRLKRPHGFANPGGFDYQSWLIQQGYSARGYIRKHRDNVALVVERELTREFVQAAIQRLRDYLRKQLSTTGNQQGFDANTTAQLSALLIGDKSGLSSEDKQLFRQAGISHLMVISGLHISLVAGVAYFIVTWLARLLVFPVQYFPMQVYGVIGAVFTACFYAVLAGMSLPTQRALLMTIVVAVLIALQRNIAAGSVVLVVVLLIALNDPLAALNGGFWLSFVAVIALLLIARQSRSQNKIRSLFTAQFAVFIGLLPLLAAIIGEVSLLAPLVNLLAIPVVSVIVVPANLLAALFSAFDIGGSSWCWWLAAEVLSLLMTMISWLISLLPKTVLHLPSPSLLTICLGSLGAVLLLLPKGLSWRWLGILLLLPLFKVHDSGLKSGELRLTMLDVGQGLALVIRTAEHQLVYDLGPRFSSGFNTAQAVVIPYLRSQGIDHVDTLMISHGDSDHAGDVEQFVDDIAVDQIVYGEILPELQQPSFAGLIHRPCSVGMRWTWNAVRFSVLSPGSLSANQHEGNNRSCVLLIESQLFDNKVLVTGDIEAQVEHALIRQYGERLQADILIVPHHGSKTSSTRHFVKTVAPRYALVSAGYRNRFGHPHHSVVTRYEKQNAIVLNTAEWGATEFVIGEHGISEPERYRAIRRRYWYETGASP